MNEAEKKTKLKARARRLSIKEGLAYSISEGFGTRYVVPYALALGANATHIGILSSIPNLVGNLSQLKTIKIMESTPRSSIAFNGALFQALMWILMILAGVLFFKFNWNENASIILLILIYTILFSAGSSFIPAWNSWMKDIVTENAGEYFGMRNRICGLIAMLSTLIAGFMLDYFKETRLFLGFIVLFSIAFLARLTSAIIFRKTYEPKLRHESSYYFSFFQFIRAMPKNNFGRFVIYVSLMSLTTAIASPFFAVYMLKTLNFNYTTYTIISVSPLLMSLIFMPAWGKLSDLYGNLKILRICGFLVPIIPFLWLASPLIFSYSPSMLILYLVLVELLSGFAWSGFKLSSSNFVYDAVTNQRMGLCTAYFNILNNFGVFLGAMLGGVIASFSFKFLSLQPLLFIFLLSGISRLMTSTILLPRINEVRDVKRFGMREVRALFSSQDELWSYLGINQMIPKGFMPETKMLKNGLNHNQCHEKKLTQMEEKRSNAMEMAAQKDEKRKKKKKS